MGSYDSPTFLGQKDKCILGLSLPQLMGSMGIGLLWFLVTMILPYSTIVRMLLVVPLTGVSLILLFVRISGISIPLYLGLMVLRLFSKPSFEETAPLVLDGQPDWLETERQRVERTSLGSRLRRRLQSRKGDIEARRVEMQAEVDKQVTSGAVAAEEWVRDGVRTIFRGG